MAVLATANASGKQLYQGQPIQTLPQAIENPTTAPTMTWSGSGGSGGYYVYVKYTWVTVVGETLPSAATYTANSILTSGGSFTVKVPDFPANVIKANVYMSWGATKETNAETPETYQGSITTSGAPFVIAGSALTATGAALPTANSTAPTSQGGVLYTAPSASANVTSPSATAYVKEIMISNVSTSSASFTLSIVPSGKSFTTTSSTGAVPNPAYAVFYNISVPPGDTKIISGINLMMPAGSSLVAMQSADKALTFTISGVEVQ